jgi:Flp pilus assembly protein TadG
MTAQRSAERGSNLVEFSLCAFLVMMMALATIEFGRMLLVYTTVSNAARAAARYAIVHGATRTGSGIDGPSGPGANPAQVLTVVRNFASTGLLDTSRLTITVSYSPSNSVGSVVSVTVVYPYDPLTTLFPLRVPLGSTTRGVIAF